MVRNSISVAVLTETWLSPDDDNEWIKSQNFNMCDYNVDCISRSNRGGGVALLSSTNIPVMKIKSQTDMFYEYGLWKIEFTRKIIHLLGIYRPPPGSANSLPNSIFIDRFLDEVEGLAVTYFKPHNYGGLQHPRQ